MLNQNKMIPIRFSYFILLGLSLGPFVLLAQSRASVSAWEMQHFKKADAFNPILQPNIQTRFYCPVQGKQIGWENKNVLNPTAIIGEGKIHLLYRAQDSLGTSRIGLATSEDGIHFKKLAKPILFPENDSLKKYEWPGGIEDPRVIRSEDGRYFLTYTSYDGKTARLCGAISSDLMHWNKIGPLFKSNKYKDVWSKSGAIVVKKNAKGNLIAHKIDGKYWMYFGDTDLFLATSTDLLHWEILENAETQVKISVLKPRAGYFDSRLVEPGPFALWTSKGILFIYNSSNAANFNDPSLAKFAYAAGQALFDPTKPYRLLARTIKPFLWPNKPYEQVGEVNEVCFVEGLVPYKHKWFLYYGTADSKIAVAIKQD